MEEEEKNNRTSEFLSCFDNSDGKHKIRIRKLSIAASLRENIFPTLEAIRTALKARLEQFLHANQKNK